MKYVFTFNEIISGRIEIEADRKPDRDAVVKHIMDGEADYHNTDYANFKLISPERQASKGMRPYER
jgi:hypothetical protein